MKLSKAIIWQQAGDQPGRRVSVLAQTITEAKAKLEAQYGEGAVYDLHNEDDAARPR